MSGVINRSALSEITGVLIWEQISTINIHIFLQRIVISCSVHYLRAVIVTW